MSFVNAYRQPFRPLVGEQSVVALSQLDAGFHVTVYGRGGSRHKTCTVPACRFEHDFGPVDVGSMHFTNGIYGALAFNELMAGGDTTVGRVKTLPATWLRLPSLLQQPVDDSLYLSRADEKVDVPHWPQALMGIVEGGQGAALQEEVWKPAPARAVSKG